MGEEDRLEIQDQEGKHSLWECFNALFGIPFGPGALLNLKSLMATGTSGLVNLGSLAGVSK